jgi:hypothetical protein
MMLPTQLVSAQCGSGGVVTAGQFVLPPPPAGLFYTDVAVGPGGIAAIRSDGQITNAPPPPSGQVYVDVAQGWFHTLALLSDGTAIAWGLNWHGQCNVPPLPSGLSYLKVAANRDYSLAIRSDGELLAWGANHSGQCNVAPLPPGVTYTEVAAGNEHALALRSDGAIAAWGLNDFGQCDVPQLPPGVTYVGVGAGYVHSLAILSDGQLAGWGCNGLTACNVPSIPPTEVAVKVAAGRYHSVALLNSGRIIGWGANGVGQLDLPPLPSGVVYTCLAACMNSTAAIDTDQCPGDPAKSFPGVCGCGVPDTISTWYLDQDGDGYGTTLATVVEYECFPPPGYALAVGDCDDANTSVYPGAPELCDGVDNDCNAVIDEGFISTYCTAGTTVAGCVPAMRGEGAPSSVAVSGFDIVVDNVPTQKMGLIFYGTSAIPQPQPWALGSTSYLCIFYPVNRTGAQSSGGSTGSCDGELRVDFNAWRAANPNALGSPFTAGQVFYAQGWFRDSGAAKGTNLSDGLMFTLCD